MSDPTAERGAGEAKGSAGEAQGSARAAAVGDVARPAAPRREPFAPAAPLPPVADAARIRAAQAGDAIAMSEVIDALVPLFGRLCGAIALDAGPDAAQEALVAVMRDLRGLREPERLVPWARRIAAREAIRHARRARSGPRADVPLAELPAPGDAALAADVRRVLEMLAPEQRAILVLRDLEGLGEAEAAAELGVALGTVKSRLHRARAAFRARWEA